MIVITFCSVAMIPLTVELYEEPVVNVSVILRITVDSHVGDTSSIKKHLAACIINIAVTRTSGETPVSSLGVA